MTAPRPLPPRFVETLAQGGLNLVAVVAAARWDAAGPPAGLSSGELLPGARSLVVVGSGGRALWPRFTAWLDADPVARLDEEPHPLDRYVRTILDEAEPLLARAGLRVRRFEPTFLFQPRLSFQRIAELARLGSPSPIGMLVHSIFGPWWALRGAWLVADDDGAGLVETAAVDGPCPGCASPCRAAIAPGDEGTIRAATKRARLACIVDGERYTDEQLTYHYDHAAGRALLRPRLGRGPAK